jgi:alcohol dehydrogenase
MSGTFRVAPAIHFGFGVSERTGELVRSLGVSRVLLVTDEGVRAAGISQRIEAALTTSAVAFAMYDRVSPNPRDYECLAAAELARKSGAEAIVAVGGGSPIDLAKAAAGLATNNGTVLDWVAPRAFTEPPLPLVAVPTTAGTGSEVTRSSVVNDTNRQIKVSLRDWAIAPKIAIVDPELTLELPPLLTASTGMDALTHAIEAYTCNRATPFSDGLALHAMRLIGPNLPVAVADGSNRAAREQMMLASTIAGMAFSNADVAAVHCIAEALGGRYDTPHGVANSTFLPWIFVHDAPADPQRHANVAVALGVATEDDEPTYAAEQAARYLVDLARTIGIPRFRELPGVREDDFPWIASASVANLSNASNARVMEENDYLAILEHAWNA